MKKFFPLLSIFFALIIVCSCSSAPKRPMLVTEKASLSFSQLDDANNSIAEGLYERAFNQLSSGYVLALSIDNTELLCKISLSGIILKLSCPDLYDLIPALVLENSAESKSFLAATKEEILENAKKYASRSGDENRKFLCDLCTIYDVKIRLANDAEVDCEKYLSMLENAKPFVSKEPFYAGFLERTCGEVCMAGGKYSAARMYYEEAVKIHTRNRYLLDVALDWYCVARSCSQNGQKDDALAAIQNALKYDRDAENTNGIICDYQAWSKILLKGNPDEEEKRLSQELLQWSEKIKAGKAE